MRCRVPATCGRQHRSRSQRSYTRVWLQKPTSPSEKSKYLTCEKKRRKKRRFEYFNSRMLADWRQKHSHAETLVLMDDECAQIVHLLRASTSAFPASMRRVAGASSILGFL